MMVFHSWAWQQPGLPSRASYAIKIRAVSKWLGFYWHYIILSTWDLFYGNNATVGKFHRAKDKVGHVCLNLGLWARLAKSSLIVDIWRSASTGSHMAHVQFSACNVFGGGGWGIAKSSFMMCPCLSPSSSLLPHVGEQWPRTFCILLNHRPLRVIKSRHVAESSRGVFKSQKTTLNLSDPKLPTLPIPACLLVKEHVRVPCMVVMRFCFDVVYIELGRASRNLTLEKPARGVEYWRKQNRSRGQGQAENSLDNTLCRRAKLLLRFDSQQFLYIQDFASQNQKLVRLKWPRWL